jgi:hypothetical protein
VTGRECNPAVRAPIAGKKTSITGTDVKDVTVIALEAKEKSSNTSFSSVQGSDGI